MYIWGPAPVKKMADLAEQPLSWHAKRAWSRPDHNPTALRNASLIRDWCRETEAPAVIHLGPPAAELGEAAEQTAEKATGIESRIFGAIVERFAAAIIRSSGRDRTTLGQTIRYGHDDARRSTAGLKPGQDGGRVWRREHRASRVKG